MVNTAEMKKNIDERIKEVWRGAFNALSSKESESGLQIHKYQFARDGSLLCAKNDYQLEQKLLKLGFIRTQQGLLVEVNDWGDNFWGVEMGDSNGLNLLGRLLMLIRDNKLI